MTRLWPGPATRASANRPARESPAPTSRREFAHDEASFRANAHGCMLRLNFRSTRGDAPTRTVAAFFRFCADGTLRGPENFLVARCVGGTWSLSGRTHRELDCEGPVRLRLSMGAHEAPVELGPFAHVRTAAGMLYGDEQ